MKYVYSTVHTVCGIDTERLFADGKRGIIIDLDNTLARWCRYEISDEVRSWVNKALSLGIRICILSNNVHKKRTEDVARMLGVLYYNTSVRKPRAGAFAGAMNVLGTTQKETVVVGDQIFSDIRGAYNSGMDAILVDPIHPREAFPTSVLRIFERLYGRKIVWQEK